jgi:hypothetical protein
MDKETSADGLEGLDLQSLDPDSLFQALTSVEKVSLRRISSYDYSLCFRDFSSRLDFSLFHPC